MKVFGKHCYVQKKTPRKHSLYICTTCNFSQHNLDWSRHEPSVPYLTLELLDCRVTFSSSSVESVAASVGFRTCDAKAGAAVKHTMVVPEHTNILKKSNFFYFYFFFGKLCTTSMTCTFFLFWSVKWGTMNSVLNVI